MSLLTDPRICPDCRAALDATQTCTGCGLTLHGADASELWRVLVRADTLIEKLRLGPSADPVRVETAEPARLPTRAPDPAPRGVSSLSVQAVLLGVGGLCVLIAAAVFVAVTWSSLGLTGRTLVLTAITGAVGSVAVVLTRRRLRGGAETLWLLTSALVTIDVIAARWAGLLGDLAPRHVAGLLGALLLIGGSQAHAWAAGRHQVRLYGIVGVATVGIVTLTAAEAWTGPAPLTATAVAVPVLIGAGLLVARLAAGRPAPIAYALGGVGVVSWWVLFFGGLARTDVTGVEWWHHLRGWPLLVAALWAAVPTGFRRLPEPLRYASSTACLVSLVAFSLGGRTTHDTEVLAVSGVALALALVTAVGPMIWARPAGVMACGAAVAGTALTLVRPFGVLALLPRTGTARSTGLGVRLPASSWTLASWTAPVIAVVAVLTALSLVRHLEEKYQPTARSLWRVGAPILVGIGAVAALLEHRPHLLPAAIVWSVLVGLAGLVTFLGRRTPVAFAGGLVITLYLVGLGLRLTVASHLLVALFATLAAAVLAVAAARARSERLDGVLVPVLAGPAVLLTAFASTHWPYVVHAAGDAAGLALVGSMALIGLGAARLGRTPATRVTIEVAALIGAAAAPFFATTDVVGALTVTLAGSAVALVSILHRDRDQLSWLAAGLLGIATLWRLADHAQAPELYAVPTACLLIAAGAWRLAHDDQVTSWRALGSGLSLGLVPSLLLTLHDPVSARGAILAGAGVLVLAAGIVGRWGAPFLAGSAVTAILAVRHLGPVAAALPRWISLGSVGVALLLVGITWEARRRDAAVAERYLAALR